MRIRTWLALAPFALGLAGAPALATDWLIVGGAGQYGDCMMEWRVQFPDSFVPKAHRDPNVKKLSPKQTCVDGDPTCDLDGCSNNSCRFRVGMCFCVDDALTTCDGRRDMFCGDPITGGPDQIGYRFSRPLKNSRRPGETENASRVLDVLVGGGFATEVADPVYYVVGLRKPLQAPGESCTVDDQPRVPAVCQPCTEYADLDVPLKPLNGGYLKNKLRFRARFDPITVDPGGDKLVLTCTPNPNPVPCAPGSSSTSTSTSTTSTTSTTEPGSPSGAFLDPAPRS